MKTKRLSAHKTERMAEVVPRKGVSALSIAKRPLMGGNQRRDQGSGLTEYGVGSAAGGGGCLDSREREEKRESEREDCGFGP